MYVLTCSKAVRQFGEVRNGHKFKRPPSKRSMLRYRAIAAEWRQRYSQHQLTGTVPADICGEHTAPGGNSSEKGTFAPCKMTFLHGT